MALKIRAFATSPPEWTRSQDPGGAKSEPGPSAHTQPQAPQPWLGQIRPVLHSGLGKSELSSTLPGCGKSEFFLPLPQSGPDSRAQEEAHQCQGLVFWLVPQQHTSPGPSALVWESPSPPSPRGRKSDLFLPSPQEWTRPQDPGGAKSVPGPSVSALLSQRTPASSKTSAAARGFFLFKLLVINKQKSTKFMFRSSIMGRFSGFVFASSGVNRKNGREIEQIPGRPLRTSVAGRFRLARDAPENGRFRRVRKRTFPTGLGLAVLLPRSRNTRPWH